MAAARSSSAIAVIFGFVVLCFFAVFFSITEHARVYLFLRELGELFVETFALVEHLFHCLDKLVLLQELTQRACGAPSGDAVMLNFLRIGEQDRIDQLLIIDLFEMVGRILDQAFRDRIL